MKLSWNKTVQTTVLAVLIVAIIPIVYVALFSAGILNSFNKSQANVSQVVGYTSQKECEEKTKATCEKVVTQTSDQYWIAPEEN